MSLLSSLVKRLPPLSVLIGAGVALASYLVSSVWKAEIDDQIDKYSAVIARTSSIENLAASLSIFQATSRFWSESIQLQLLKGGDTSPDVDLSPSINDEVVRAVTYQERLIQEFFSTLPEEVRSLKMNPALWGIYNYDPDRFRNCMDTVAGRYAPLTYGDALFELYMTAARDALTLEGVQLGDHPTSLTLEQNAKRLFTRINIGRDAADRIAKADSPSSPNDSKGETIYSRERQRTIRCLETAEEAILDDLAYLSQLVRSTITEKFIEPLSRTKRKIGIVETLLYIMSGLIALSGQMRSEPRGLK